RPEHPAAWCRTCRSRPGEVFPGICSPRRSVSSNTRWRQMHEAQGEGDMATGQLTAVIQHLRHTALRGGDDGRTDGELLGAFLARQDQKAFETLVWRHGPMVLGVCRRILRH